MTPKIGAIDGSYEWDRSNHILCWAIDSIAAENNTGSFEFSTNGESINEDTFFPIEISFSSKSSTYGDIKVIEAIM